MSSLCLFTETLFFLGRTKRLFKMLLRRGIRGPAAVENSLLTGLKQLNAAYFLNNSNFESGAVAGVLNGLKTLSWTIKQKKAGRISKIIAGPNLVVLPSDNNGILKNRAIDLVLVPCLWVQKAYEKDAPELIGKIRIWPAGVDLPEVYDTEKTIDFLVFDKQDSPVLAAQVKLFLRQKGFRTSVVGYGAFTQKQYYAQLSASRGLVYLGKTESQGIALFEAWARNVPTLVYGQHDPSGNTPSAAPYLTPGCGMFFTNVEELGIKTLALFDAKLEPRIYIEQNFTHVKCAESYLSILEEVA